VLDVDSSSATGLYSRNRSVSLSRFWEEGRRDARGKEKGDIIGLNCPSPLTLDVIHAPTGL
jgi:hypothetical protein